MSQFSCQKCHHIFYQKSDYERHLARKNPCDKKKTVNLLKIDAQSNKITSSYICNRCNNHFSRIDSLQRHQKESWCAFTDHNFETESKIQQMIKNQDLVPKSEIARIEAKFELSLAQMLTKLDAVEKRHPMTINNNLQIVCVQHNDNYLDRLTDRMGDFQQALEFIKDCALSSLHGDCRLIEKVYFEIPATPAPIRKNGKKIEYSNEKGQVVIDPNGKKLCEILVNNLQNSYLKGRQHIAISTTIAMKDYDIDCWNNHIYELQDAKYQKKLLININLPQV
jgi:hypothetical protein